MHYYYDYYNYYTRLDCFRATAWGNKFALRLQSIQIGSERPLTNQRQQVLLCTLDQLLVDLDGQVTEHLLVARQLKVGQAVLVLPRGVVFGEVLRQEKEGGR